MPEFDPPLISLLQILHFAFIYFLLFSKIIYILSKKFHIFELSFLLNDVHGLEGGRGGGAGAGEGGGGRGGKGGWVGGRPGKGGEGRGGKGGGPGRPATLGPSGLPPL